MKINDGTKKSDLEQNTRKRISTSGRAVRTAKRFKETIIEEDEGDDEESGEDMDQDREVTNNEILAEIKKLQKKVSDRADEQDVRIDDMQSEIDELRQEIAELRSEIDQVHIATRKQNLIFCGVPEDRVETPEKTFNKVYRIIERDLGQIPEIDTVKRLKNSAVKFPRKILVVFRTARAVERILENKHKLRGIKTERIYINKDMPPRVEKLKHEMRREDNERDDYYGKYYPDTKSTPANKEEHQRRSRYESDRSSMIRENTPAKKSGEGAWQRHESGRCSRSRGTSANNASQGAWQRHESGRGSMSRGTPANNAGQGAWARNDNDRRSMATERVGTRDAGDGGWGRYENDRRSMTRERTPASGRNAGRNRRDAY